MEQLVKDRKYLRRSFTIANTNFTKAVNIEENQPKVKSTFNILKDKAERLFQIDEVIKKNRKAEDLSEREEEEEFENVEKYREDYCEGQVMLETYLQNNWTTHHEVDKKPVKLPELKLQEFDGNVQNWLGFWNQYKRIHENKQLSSEDKFQYLLQSTKEGSKARELVESYQPSSSNYNKVIEELNTRFGREEYLIEYYTRELYKVILGQMVSKKHLSLSDLYTKLQTQLSVLDSLGVTKDKCALLLFPLVESALPSDCLKIWERQKSDIYKSDNDVNVLEKLMLFLKVEVESEERVSLAKQDFPTSGDSDKKGSFVRKESLATGAALLSTSEPEYKKLERDKFSKYKNKLCCLFCEKNNHESSNCFQIKNLSVHDKRLLISKGRGCFICLRKGHQAKDCKVPIKCLICKRAHHIVLCTELEEKQEDVSNKEKGNNEFSNCNNSRAQVFLQTLLVKVEYGNKSKIVRAMMDSGSQHSYIRSDLARELQCERMDSILLNHNMFGGSTAKQNHNRYIVKINNLNNNFSCKVPVLNQKIICKSIPRAISLTEHSELSDYDIVLSDINKGHLEISILLGADVMATILTGNLKHINKMLAVETLLGWTIMGKCDKELHDTDAIDSLSLNTISDLWALDTIGIKDPIEVQNKNKHNLEVMRNLEKNIHIRENRYQVPLPWKGTISVLDNRHVAEKRLLSVTKRLESIKQLKQYDAVFQNWCEQDIIEEVIETESDKLTGHYLPHRPVFKIGSSTPIRPVFDASCKDFNGVCLNDCLETGPNLIDLLPKFLLQFRLKQIGVVADIRKAFLQILICESDRNKLKFLWWKDREKKEIKVFKHKRLVFGLTCSPFILNLVIKYHLESVPKELSETARKLLQAFYVDNCVFSIDSREELEIFIKEANAIMSIAKFELTQWSHTLSVQSEDIFTGMNKKEKIVNVLGMLWNCETDTVSCFVKLNKLNKETQITKRNILSYAQQIFDPMGFITPITLIPKLILQECWQRGFQWDEEVSEDLQKRFRSWIEELSKVAECRLPRHVGCINKETSTLHVFSDASGVAYSVCIFLRTIINGEVKVQFLFSKARVAPIGVISNIPRLELMGATIAARSGHLIKTILNDYGLPIFYWTDSRIVLSWIKNLNNDQVFVRNRVQEILTLCDREQWGFVNGKYNPADLPSRGCSIETFLKSKWWLDVPWLHTDPIEYDREEASDIFAQVTSSADLVDEPKLFQYFSSYTKTIRMVGWMLRFGTFKGRLTKGKNLTLEEIETAENKILHIIQQQSSVEKIDIHVKTVINSQGLTCVKTKLLEGPFCDNFKFPVLLPYNHIMVERLVREFHWRNKHVGTETLISIIREKFWICRIRRLIKRVTKNCIICSRYNAKSLNVPDAPLPADRVTTGKAFQVTGIDMCGPLFLKDGTKSYIVLFTCAVYRAVHLECVTDLSTDTFILALRRFIARRGRISVIYSDNATYFRGTYNRLYNVQIDWNQVQSITSLQKIHWKFLPPAAPWWGGWWERLIGVLKNLLRRNLGKNKLNYEELYTLVCDCESMINARPLTYVTSDVNDLIVVKPSNFTQDIDSNEIPDLDQISESHFHRRARFLQKMREALRSRFRKEYLAQLIHVRKNKPIRELEVGEVVLMGSDNVKRTFWPMAIVEKIIEGVDGHKRTAVVRTTSGSFVRPLQRLFPLELRICDVLYQSTQSSECEVPQDEVEEDEEQTKVYTSSGRQVKAIKRLDL